MLSNISDSEFEALVAAGIDAIPEDFLKELKNVAIVTAEYPTPDQLKKGKTRPGWLLFGLYEGIPRTERNHNYSGILPDKITIFKQPLLAVAQTESHLQQLVKNTVWHEIAHHFGLGHDRIHELENHGRIPEELV